MANKHEIIIPKGAKPEPHEVYAAEILRDYFECDVTFLAPSHQHGVHTPDVKINGVLWEIKAPKGNSKNTIENNIKEAKKQSSNIVIDTHRTEMSDEKIRPILKKEISKSKSIRRLIMIDKKRCLHFEKT